MSDIGVGQKELLGEKVTSELREFAVLSGYLYVCFTALAYFKASILQAHEIDFAPWAFAAIKALVSAKFMLIGRALNLGEGFKSYPLIVPTLYKSCIFVVLVVGSDRRRGGCRRIPAWPEDSGFNGGARWRDSRAEDRDQHHPVADLYSLLRLSLPRRHHRQ